MNSHYRNGIYGDPEDIQERLSVYGTNKKPVKEPPGFFELVCEALEDFTLRILIVAALLTIAIGCIADSIWNRERTSRLLGQSKRFYYIFLC